MNKELQKHLTAMSDVDFILLEHHFYLARQIRDAITRRGLNDKDMAAILGVSPKQMKAVKNGSYPFDLMLMAKLQTYNEQQAANDAKFKIEAESIGFADYKYKYPTWVSKIEKLIEILEANNHSCKNSQ